MQWYLKVLRQYFDFEGRARRKEYWMFFLVNIIVSFVIGFTLGFIGALINMPSLQDFGQIYSLIVFIPSIAVGVRRVHDSDYKGWWLLCPFFNFYLLVVEGTKGANRFGPDPKAGVADQSGGAAIA